MFFAAGREVFREFLRSEYSEENMLFWLAVEDLKKESDVQLVEEKARLIYEDYISILSPKEVNSAAAAGCCRCRNYSLFSANPEGMLNEREIHRRWKLIMTIITITTHSKFLPVV